MRAFGTSDASSVQPSEIQVLAKTHARRNKYEYLFSDCGKADGEAREQREKNIPRLRKQEKVIILLSLQLRRGCEPMRVRDLKRFTYCISNTLVICRRLLYIQILLSIILVYTSSVDNCSGLACIRCIMS